MSRTLLLPDRWLGATVCVTLLLAWATLPEHARPWFNALLVAPVLEEVVFRAGLQDTLLDAGVAPAWANAGTAAAFCAAHVWLLGASWQAAAVLLPALVIGMAYSRWRRLRICIGLHIAMNALWLAFQRLS